MEPILKMLALLGITIGLKVVEHANKIKPGGTVVGEDGKESKFLVRNVTVAYGVLNLQLSLSIGSLGIVWGSLKEQQTTATIFYVSIAIFLCALLGAIFRGLVSKGEPTAMKMSDWDWRFGVIIANGFGFAALFTSTVYQLTR
jgi:hypothetical protein